MKHTVLSLLFIFTFLNSYAQSSILEYALKQEGKLHIGIFPRDRSKSLKDRLHPELIKTFDPKKNKIAQNHLSTRFTK